MFSSNSNTTGLPVSGSPSSPPTSAFVGNCFELFNETLGEVDCDDSFYLTQKTIKPIVMGHPFMVLSTKHFLKNLKELGFKTFVDPTTLSFPSNLTGVIGPNGCGKSNIVDAIRWVMGEASAKNLRGDSMEDVIFSGSSSREPVGKANVELYFDNSENTLDLKFAKFNEILCWLFDYILIPNILVFLYLIKDDDLLSKEIFILRIFISTGVGQPFETYDSP